MVATVGINRSSHWFVPLADLNNPRGSVLRRADSSLEESDQLIEEGGDFTISLESFSVQGAHDRQSDNDLLVRSWVKYGNEPRAEVINFFGINIPSRTVIDDLQSEHIFAKQDYSEENRVHLELEIFEVDRDISDDRSIISGLSDVAGELGAAFVQLAPFTTIAATVLKGIDRIRSFRDKDKRIFRSSFDLYRKGSSGETPLRCGAYVLFNEPEGAAKAVEGVQYKLRGLRLERAAPSQAEVPIADDYIVIKIEPEIVHSGGSEDLLANQQLAVVLGNLEAEETRSASARHWSLKS